MEKPRITAPRLLWLALVVAAMAAAPGSIGATTETDPDRPATEVEQLDAGIRDLARSYGTEEGPITPPPLIPTPRPGTQISFPGGPGKGDFSTGSATPTYAPIGGAAASAADADEHSVRAVIRKLG